MKCPHCSEPIDNMVPRDRLNAKTAKIAELEAAAATTAESLEAATQSAARAGDLEAQLTAARAEFDAFRAETATATDLMRAGVVDGEDQALVRWRYSRLENPPAFGDWLANDARADKHISALFEAPPATTVEETPAPAAPNANAGAAIEQPAPPARYSVSDVQRMPIDELRDALASGAFR